MLLPSLIWLCIKIPTYDLWFTYKHVLEPEGVTIDFKLNIFILCLTSKSILYLQIYVKNFGLAALWIPTADLCFFKGCDLNDYV